MARLVLVGCIVLALFTSQSEKLGHAREAIDNPSAMRTATYQIRDLPVYSQHGKQDIVLFEKYIVAKIGTKAWADSSLVHYPTMKSVLVNTTIKNHKAIAKILDELRPSEL